MIVPDTIRLHCSNHDPSKWIQVPREKVVIMLDLEKNQWIFESVCHLCGADILNTRGMYR